jgi:DNA-binding MarR family transcriptional regulator
MTLTDELVQDLPPSAKLVLKVLEYNGGLTQKQIVENSRLSQRTVRDALDRLQEHEIVEKDIYIPDARQNIYRLPDCIDAGTPDDADADGATIRIE